MHQRRSLGVLTRPGFSTREAGRILDELFGLQRRLQPLPSERDQNFLVFDGAIPRYVLKIANSAEDRAVLELQCRAMEHLRLRGVPCPAPVMTSVGASIASRGEHFIRLLSCTQSRSTTRSPCNRGTALFPSSQPGSASDPATPIRPEATRPSGSNAPCASVQECRLRTRRGSGSERQTTGSGSPLRSLPP